ncbi:hypothetical protein NHX12_002098 [Muraenolepis orangiensis]|uniref:Uncharacterized protein n=1 Tax=Muraenolepis orangiensis TaxID=630683 RepID=A0A9Q0E5W7_9TELE|nr:hypothetical protein NHX12_002098 [Muraenolepis orangiensis]
MERSLVACVVSLLIGRAKGLGTTQGREAMSNPSARRSVVLGRSPGAYQHIYLVLWWSSATTAGAAVALFSSPELLARKAPQLRDFYECLRQDMGNNTHRYRALRDVNIIVVNIVVVNIVVVNIVVVNIVVVNILVVNIVVNIVVVNIVANILG